MIAAYLGFAAWSAHISPLARGPLLDGVGPVNYRWVAPPPELASSNEAPSSGAMLVELDPKTGSLPVFVRTDDNQAVFLINQGSIGPATRQQQAAVTIEPLDPAGFPELGGEQVAFSNVYRVHATYEPSGQPVRELASPILVTLVYGHIPGVHTRSHDLLQLRGGTGGRWRAMDTEDLIANQQAQGESDALGTFVVAGVPVPFTPVGSQEGGDTNPALIAVLVLAGCVLLIGVGLLLRSRGAPEA